MEKKKLVAFSVKPPEQKLMASLKEAGHYYTKSALMRAALYALAEKILPVNTPICVKEGE